MRTTTMVVLGLGASLVGGSAGARTDALDTARGARAIDPLPPPSAAGLRAEHRPQRLGDKILFVNFDGAQMSFCGNNNPANNCSTIFGGTVLPFSGDMGMRASVVQTIRKRVADFGITVTDQRPPSGDYDMEMVGNWQGQDPSFAGVAPSIDCFDSNGGETSFTLEASGSADGIAEIVLQEVAHTWGLEHVNQQQDLLYPTTQGSSKTFHDECYKIVSDTQLNESNGSCNAVHTNFCSFGWQNSYQELLWLFGPSVPDTIAPTVTIVAPANGATLEGDFELVFMLADDQTPAVIELEVMLDGDALELPVTSDGAYASPQELAFPIVDLPDGTYTARVDIVDESDNPASDEITFTVVGNPPPDEGVDETGDPEGGSEGGGSEGGSGGGGESETDGEGPTGSGSAGVVEPSPATDEGCDCRSGRPRPGPGLGLGLLALLGLGRRRRAG